MSWLFIDSADSERARIGLLARPRVRAWIVRGRSRAFLRMLATRVPLAATRAIDGVCVVHGPGSFSSVRGGVLIANLLARLLHKPLVGVHRAQAEDLTALASRLASGSVPVSGYVMPTYTSEPHITISGTSKKRPAKAGLALPSSTPRRMSNTSSSFPQSSASHLIVF